MKLDNKWQVLIIISIGIFMSTLDGSILNIANPTIAREMSVDMKQVQWVVTAYMLVITSTLLFFGKLGDRIGSHKIYTFGFLGFAIGSLFCSISTSLILLIASRAFQAFGASMMMATGIGIVSNTFPPEERGKALGLTGSMVGIGNMTGPSLGGILVAKFGWPVIFLLNIPVGLIGFYLAYRFLPSQPVNSQDKKFDFPGILLFSIAAIVLVLSLSVGDSIQFGPLLAGIILLACFYIFEKKSPSPMLDFELFRVKPFLYGNILGCLAYVSQTWVIFLMPFFMERLLHFSPAYSGLMMTIPPIFMAVTAPFAGSLSDKFGPTRLTSISFILLSGAHLTFSTLGQDASIFRIAGGLVLLGIGMGFFGSPNNSSILSSVPQEKAGYTGGFISTVRNFSFSIGIAVSASIFSLLLNIYQENLSYAIAYSASTHWVYRISALITLSGLLISVLSRNERKSSKSVLLEQEGV
jgi:EmrB/QacA subfamily drug resistance transporter